MEERTIADAGAPDSTALKTDHRRAERITELLDKMSVKEKLAQLYGVWVGLDATGGTVAPHQHEMAPVVSWPELIVDGIGQLTRPFGTAPVEPAIGLAGLVDTQRAIVAAGRWGIPALVHEECLTGLAAWKATVYPSPLCWGATFDPNLIQRMAANIGRTMRRLGIHQGLAPVLDVARDLRWGRIEETIGEDPYLVGSIGSAYVRGLESAGIVATLKHFVGYSASRAGRNLAPVSAGPRELADILLPPFEMALRAGARSVMNSYADIDGLPVAADPGLLTDVLRSAYGFTGTVVADYFAISFLHILHHVAGTPQEAAALALRAGIDVELPTVSAYGPPLAAAVADGTVPMALVDRALSRVLTQKAELGLLDTDWDPDPAGATSDGAMDELDDAESRALAGEVARRAVVLVQRNEVLPLPRGVRLAVVGPRAETPQAMMGCYSFPMHVGVHHPEVPVGIDISTVLDALRSDPNGFEVGFARGCPVTGGHDQDGDAEIEAAARLAADADICVAVLGDQAGLFGNGTSGEGCDAADLKLPGRQEELLEAVLTTGTPVVLVLLSGRPYELSRQADRLAGVLCGFFPGEEGAAAIVDVLTGRIEPSGRLPVSFPGAGAVQPSTYLGSTLTRRSEVSVIDPSPLWGFGHGLAYHPVTWGSISADTTDWPIDGRFAISVHLRNDADVAVSEVVQVYLHDPVAEIARPVQQLLAAPRIDVAAGQSVTVGIDLYADQLSYTGRRGDRQVDPGEVELQIGASSTDIREVIRATVIGDRRTVGFDRVMHADVVVH